MCGPSAVLHPPKRCHSDIIGRAGLETFSIQFDPDWLGVDLWRRLDRSSGWAGGSVAANATRLVGVWRQTHLREHQLKAATVEFISEALATAPIEVPARLKTLRQEIRSSVWPSTTALAHKVGLHPAWLARSYRSAFGEGLTDTRRRCRVERAVELLRTTHHPLAEVAAACGFSDQSHMNRNFSQLLGRTPLQVRQERELLGVSPHAVQSSTHTPCAF